MNIKIKVDNEFKDFEMHLCRVKANQNLLDVEIYIETFDCDHLLMKAMQQDKLIKIIDVSIDGLEDSKFAVLSFETGPYYRVKMNISALKCPGMIFPLYLDHPLAKTLYEIYNEQNFNKFVEVSA